MISDYKNIEIKEVIVEAGTGSALDLCIHEAMMLACKERVKVRLVHNGNTYMIDPQVLREFAYNSMKKFERRIV
jgi:hypothetical protein